MRITPSAALVAAALSVAFGSRLHSQQPAFRVEEITIAGIHEAIQQGRTTCVGVVQAYVDRTRAYNGVSNYLVTKDGGDIPKPPGQVRGGAPLAFPMKTIAIDSVLPNFGEYKGPPIEFGRMEATASDPEVMQQYGMTVGIPNAGQVNALGMINLRGERSTTCKGDRDTHPSKGPLPAGTPNACEELRKLPDALERAAELDAKYGKAPDLKALPMYCVPFSFKDPFDTKDMRSTGGGDARYDIDFPARDHTLVAQLRAKGAIIYAKANTTEYNGRAGDPGGKNKPDKVLVSTLGYQRSTWAGNPSNPYDTTRAASLGSSSGSGVSVGANLVTCSLCEETRASCRGPANHNSVALLLPQKALVSFHGGAIGSDIHNDRTGIHCRQIADSAKVLDALRDPVNGYYDPRDVFTTIPRSAVLDGSYAAAAAQPGSKGSLKGMRIGIIRESMLTFPGIKADEPIVKAASAEIKQWLGDHLGATLVESTDPKWVDDPAIENMTTSYTKALAELIPVFFPDILYRVQAGEGGRRGFGAGAPGGELKPVFPDFAAAITPTPFAPGLTFGSGTMQPADYMVAMADGKVPVPANLNIRTVQPQAPSKAFRFHFVQYATRRAADWKALGYEETLVDFPTLNARSKFWGDDQRAAFKNWEETPDIRNPLDERQGIHERFLLRELLRRVEMKVLQENKLDVVVRLHTPLPPGKIGLAGQPGPEGDTRGESAFGPNGGLTEVLIPAGYVREVYDPVFVLSADKTRYIPTNNNTPITVPAPGLPFSLVFRADPGKEDLILKVASAYQAASKRRVPPPAFGPVVKEAPRPTAASASGQGGGQMRQKANGRSMITMVVSGAGVGLVAALSVLAGPAVPSAQVPAWRFQLEEATIDDVHRAIKEGQISCQGLVKAYLNRARAYNGVASELVTEDMAPKYLPDYDKYKAAVLATAALKDGDPKKTPPIEFGRLEPTASDPEVQQQYGMVVGKPNAGQLRAMGMLNVRGERTVTCKGDRDRHPSKGPLPAGSPAVCEELRKMPDALERAAELDAQFGRNPDLAAMPMYCIPFSFKDPFDTKDMRSTGGGDTRYDIDFPARDQTLVAQLRAKGAIIYAKANTTEYNGRGGNPGGTHFPTKVLPSTLGYQRSTWAGNPSGVYDTTRAASIGSSSGSGVSVGANLVMCSLCEETGASCRGPSNHNSSALILPHKSLISFHGGSIGASIYQDRAGIVCRTVADSAKVLDALKDPVNGYYDPRDIFTTVPRSSVLDGYAKHVAPGTAGSLKGMRIGIVREFMIPHAKADEAIVAAAAKEMKAMLAGHLGATLVETVPAGWTDDPEVENMKVDFDRAIAQITPVIYPELLYKLVDGAPKFPAFAAKIKPTEFAPGKTFGTGTMQPVDWMMRWAEGTEPGPPNLNVRSMISATQARTFRFHLAQYLTRRAEDWKARGFTETVADWKTLNERSKFWGDDQRAAFLNWGDVEDVRNDVGSAQGIAEQVQLRELLRRVIQKVMAENKLDVMIQLHSALPPGKIGLAPEPVVNDRSPSYSFGPHAGITEVLIPAGYVRVAYDATFELATDANGRKIYRGTTSTTPTEIPAPGLPFSINFWTEPGMEHLTLRAASAYQAASKRRVPPPMFGPLPGEPGSPAPTAAAAAR